jgi:hypothetical protein
MRTELCLKIPWNGEAALLLETYRSSVISGISRPLTTSMYNSSSIANFNCTMDTLASRLDIPQEIIDAIIDELGSLEKLCHGLPILAPPQPFEVIFQYRT